MNCAPTIVPVDVTLVLSNLMDYVYGVSGCLYYWIV